MKPLARSALLAGLLGALFLLARCSPYEPPVIEASALPDTLDTTGPYPVAAAVTSRRSLSAVELVWHNASVSPGDAVHVPMTLDDQGVWRASIPGAGVGATIAYHVEAEDSSGDRGYAPQAAQDSARCGQEYCFSILAP